MSQELLLYLLQLVQALRFDHGPEQRKKRKIVEEEDSGLSTFLIDRAVANPILGTSLHWYLMIECDARSPVGKAYAKVAFRFMQRLAEVSCPSSIQLMEDARRSSSARSAQASRRVGGVIVDTSQRDPPFKRRPVS